MFYDDELNLLGGSPSLPLGDLNLAGSQGVPDPEELFAACLSSHLIEPDYEGPDLAQPSLRGGNPADAPLTLPNGLTHDPLQSDLREGPHPFAVDFLGDADLQDEAKVDTVPLENWPGLGFSELQVSHTVTGPDPLLPSLQQPELGLEVQMPDDERPGNLAPAALEAMHQSPDYQQVAKKNYPAVFLDQHGMNNHRSRDFTLLLKGLDAEEQGKEL